MVVAQGTADTLMPRLPVKIKQNKTRHSQLKTCQSETSSSEVTPTVHAVERLTH